MKKNFLLLFCTLVITQNTYSQHFGFGITYFKDAYTLFNVSILRDNPNGTQIGTTISIGGYESNDIITNSSDHFSYVRNHYGIGLNLVYRFSSVYLTAGTLLDIKSGVSYSGADQNPDTGLLFNGGISAKPFDSVPISLGIHFLFDKSTSIGAAITFIL